MTIDPDLFQTRMINEGRMWNTQNKAVQGSRTAQNLADVADLAEGSRGVPDAARSLLNLQFGDAVVSAIRPVMDAASGMNNETRKLIARALLSDDPREALRVAAAQDMSETARKRLIEAIMRSSGIRAIASE